MILARAECDFIRPVNPGERIDIWMGTTKIGRTSMSIDCEMLDERGATCGEGARRDGHLRLCGGETGPRARLGAHAIEEYEGRQLSRP